MKCATRHRENRSVVSDSGPKKQKVLSSWALSTHPGLLNNEFINSSSPSLFSNKIDPEGSLPVNQLVLYSKIITWVICHGILLFSIQTLNNKTKYSCRLETGLCYYSHFDFRLLGLFSNVNYLLEWTIYAEFLADYTTSFKFDQRRWRKLYFDRKVKTNYGLLLKILSPSFYAKVMVLV